MPRSKRRSASDMASEEDERHFNKRLRSAQSYSERRHSKGEEALSQHFSKKRCLAWFRQYTTPDDPDILAPAGMEKFCQDIGVAPENIVMLVLAWKMNAKQMGYFTQQEWCKGLNDMQIDTISKLQSSMDLLRNYLADQQCFKSIYRYAYDFARDKDQRSMDMETAKAMLQLLLGKYWPLFTEFNRFLEHSKYKVINKDQWCNILEFSRTITDDLANYDVDGAWPVMLDEFVEWLKASSKRGNEAYQS